MPIGKGSRKKPKTTKTKWREKAEREGVQIEFLPESERVKPAEIVPPPPESPYSLASVHAKRMGY